MNAIRSKINYIIKKLRDRENKGCIKILLDLIKYSSRLGLSPGEYFTYNFNSRKATDVFVLAT